MSRYWKQSLIVLVALAVFVPIASARPGFFVRGYYGPGFYGPGYGWYGPGWGYAWAPYEGHGGPVSGKVKIDTKAKDASVYVDGGFAGTVGDLKTFDLRAGTHDIELRDHDGHSFYQERVDVIAGKTTKLVP